MLFKNKINFEFKNIGFAMIGIIFLIIIGNIPTKLYKIIMILLIPLLTSPLIFQKLDIKSKEDFKKNIKIILLIIGLEIIVIGQLFFLGMAQLPFLISPLNNLFFWGVVITLICSELWKKGKYNKKNIKIILISYWFLMILYQFFVNYEKIKGVW